MFESRVAKILSGQIEKKATRPLWDLATSRPRLLFMALLSRTIDLPTLPQRTWPLESTEGVLMATLQFQFYRGVTTR